MDTQSKAKWFRIKVTDVNTGAAKATVNLPMGIVNWGLRMGSKFGAFGGANLESINLDELQAALNSGISGKILEATDEAKGEHVEIFVE